MPGALGITHHVGKKLLLLSIIICCIAELKPMYSRSSIITNISDLGDSSNLTGCFAKVSEVEVFEHTMTS